MNKIISPLKRIAVPPSALPEGTEVEDPTTVERLTVDSTGLIYAGLSPLFDICTDADLMSLSFEGTTPFLDWIGWERTNLTYIRRAFIDFVRAAASDGSASHGWLADPCGDSNGVEKNLCDFTLTDFARLRRHGPTRDITKINDQYCYIQPRYRLDGSMITDDREYDMRLATEVIIQDLKSMVINGNKSTAGQFSGLEQLVATGYTSSDGSTCKMMDSIVINWNDNTMDGGSGITWNGAAVGSTFNMISVLQAVVRQIRHRIRLSPMLAAQNLSVGDIIIVMPEDYIPCLLDAFTCWMVCDNDRSQLNSLDARVFRDKLNGGLYGGGEITIDNFVIPIMPFDWGLIGTAGEFDMYVLTGSVGNVKIIQGQYNDMAPVPGYRPDRFATDAGRLLTWRDDDETCEIQQVEMQPRMLIWAPWAQARIESVICGFVNNPLSADPWSGYFPY